MKESIQQEIQLDLLRGFVRRMLVYYDPLRVTFLGAPEDEYDTDIEKIISLIHKNFATSSLAIELFALFSGDVEDKEVLKRKTQRMAEDIQFLLNSQF